MTTDDELAAVEESTAILDYRIGIIESTIRKAGNIPAARRAELSTMLAGLKSELVHLTKTHHEEAASITRFADASAHEASRSRRNKQLTETALHGLRSSIRGFENSHPSLVRMVERFATTLSNMGL